MGKTMSKTKKDARGNALKDRLFALYKRWCALERRAKDLDFERSVWARDALAEFDADDQFRNWCADELMISASQIDVLLNRAAVATVVAEASTWRRLGGFAQLQSLLAIPAAERTRLVESAEGDGRTIRALVCQHMAERGETPPPRANSLIDVRVLAAFIRERLNDNEMPPNVATIVQRYSKTTALDAVEVDARVAA